MYNKKDIMTAIIKNKSIRKENIPARRVRAMIDNMRGDTIEKSVETIYSGEVSKLMGQLCEDAFFSRKFKKSYNRKYKGFWLYDLCITRGIVKRAIQENMIDFSYLDPIDIVKLRNL